MTVLLVSGGVLISSVTLASAAQPKAEPTQTLVGVGSFGKRAPVLEGRFSLYFINPHNAGNVMIDKIVILREDKVVTLEVAAKDIKTPKGDDNILEPFESWEFIIEKFTPTPPDAKLTYSAVVYWKADKGYKKNQLLGWWYQKIIYKPGDTPPQLTLTQVPLVNVIQK
jgi:hypothetical protein